MVRGGTERKGGREQNGERVWNGKGGIDMDICPGVPSS